jgi:hypothetical protein
MTATMAGDGSVDASARSSVPSPSDLDLALTLQFAVAWAGEGGETLRLGWWRSNLATEWGGRDLFERLMPDSADWAVLQAARAVAVRCDQRQRANSHDPDNLLSLFALGFDTDERVAERLAELKASRAAPSAALPRLGEVLHDPWNRARFETWLEQFETPAVETVPLGRRIRGPIPAGLDLICRRLVGALAPLPAAYPLPHFQRRGP